MTTNSMSDAAPTNRLHYAWIVLATTTLVLLTSGGVRAAIGVFVKPLEAEFGWSRTLLSFAVAMSIALYGLTGPFVGRLADRVGPRWVLTGGVVLVGIGTVGGAGVTQFWQFFLAVGLIAAVGSSATAAPVAATVATRWFDKHRGLVLGINGAGMAAGQLVVLPLAMALVAYTSWRGAFLILGAGLLVLVAPLAAIFMRNDPSERGLYAYGATEPPRVMTAAQEAAERTPVSEAVRTWPFLLLCGSFWVCGYSTFGVILAHFIPYATDHGFHPGEAAGALGVMGAMNIVGTIGSGWLCDRLGPKFPLALYYLFRGLSLFCLPFVTTVPGLYAFAALFGLNFISTVPATTTLTARIYGRYSVGELSGWIFASHQLGGAIGAVASGWLFDKTGDYTMAFYAAGAWAVIATVMVLFIRDEPITRTKQPTLQVSPATS
jgi:sugar phosphate permease